MTGILGGSQNPGATHGRCSLNKRSSITETNAAKARARTITLRRRLGSRVAKQLLWGHTAFSGFSQNKSPGNSFPASDAHGHQTPASLVVQCRLTPATLQGPSSLKSQAGATPQVLLVLSHPGSWTEWLPGSLALQSADGHCGTTQPNPISQPVNSTY